MFTTEKIMLNIFHWGKTLRGPLQIVPLHSMGPIEVLLWPFPIESLIFPC